MPPNSRSADAARNIRAARTAASAQPRNEGWARRLKGYTAASIVALLGTVVSLLLFGLVHEYYADKAENVLDEATESFAHSLARSADRYLEVVQSIGGLYAASKAVDRDEFRAFVRPSLARYLGIRALKWVPRVSGSERPAYERSAREEGFADFHLKELAATGNTVIASQREVYYPVFFLEPRVGNETMLGLDLTSNPERFKALAQARDSGQMAAAVVFDRARGPNASTRLVAFSPIYRKGPTPNTVEGRREALEGFALGVIQISDMVEQSITMASSQAFDLYLYDDTDGPSDQFLYRNAAHADRGPAANLSRTQLNAGFSWSENIKVAGRTWTIFVSPRAAHFGGEDKLASWATLLVGLTLTALLTHYLYASRNRARLVEQTVALRTSELSTANKTLKDEVANRRQAEQALTQSEARLRDSIESLNDGFALFDSEERLILFNKKYRDFDATIAEFLVPNVTFDELTAAGLARNQWPEAEGSTRAWIESQTRARRNPGESLERKLDDGRWLLIRLNKTSEGGLVDVRTDITTLKEREEQLQLRESELLLHRDHLESLVEERTYEVQEQAEQLKEALNKEKEFNALQREFVLMASHEFRTPLAIIDSTVQRVTRRSDKLDQDDLTRRMTKIRNAVTRMTTLIDSTLSASRLDGDKIDLQPKPVDLRQLIAEVCQHQQEIAKSHEITWNLDQLPDTILGDPALLYRVFTNLLSNAIKYSPNHPQIEIGGGRDGDHVVIFVRDHGVGIPEAELSKIFGRFFRAATSSGIPGTGIGLNLVMRLVEMHQGTIAVESGEGRGSTFTVRLPLDLHAQSEAKDNGIPPAAVADELSAFRDQMNG